MRENITGFISIQNHLASWGFSERLPENLEMSPSEEKGQAMYGLHPFCVLSLIVRG